MRNIEEYKKMNYRVILEYRSQDHAYVARFPELPGCIAHGDTPQSALNYALKIKDDWLETAFDSGWSIPEPSEAPETSGRITVRTPKYMHKQLIGRAEEDRVSLNQLILSFIAQGLERATQEHVLKEVSAKQDKIIAFLAEKPTMEVSPPLYGVLPMYLGGKTMQAIFTQSVANSASNIVATISSGANTALTLSPLDEKEENKELAAKVPTFDEYDKNYQTGGCLL
jgi:predicted RNase H-like HicB family nuclease